MDCLLNRVCNLRSLVKCTAFHTSTCIMGSRQTGNAMRKVLGVTQKKKLRYSDIPKMPTPEIFSKGVFEGKRSGNSRRANVLNKLFMRHITDQMATGSCAPEILGHGIEINMVKITPDYKIVNVYWIAKGTAQDEIVDKILDKSAGIIRHELSQLRVMGVVPIIQFVRDKHYAKIVELDSRLAIADFGDDHTPLDSTEKLKTEFEILAPLPTDIKERLEELDNKECDEFEDLPLPLMPQNVLGLNHSDILDRVQKSMKKSEALHRQSSCQNKEDDCVTFNQIQTENDDPIQLSGRTQREVFKEFLHKRQLLRLKAKREEKNNIPDLEYIRQELRERHMSYLSKFDISENIEEDFIHEDLEEENK